MVNHDVLVRDVPSTRKKVIIFFEKSDMAPKVLLDEYDLIEVDFSRPPLVNVHIKKDKDDRWAASAECVVLDNKVMFLVTAITAKQQQIERHQNEIAKLVAQLKKYAVSENPPPFKSV